MEKVSIVIPAYNASKTLMQCYESILSQTYQNFEVITVNDASKDNSLEIMNEMSKKDPRFISIDMPHGGVSRARNTGLRFATGKYLQFMDADDTLKPNMIEKMITLIEKNDADLAVCRFEHPFFQTHYDDRVYDLSQKEDLLKLYQDPFGLVMPWNKIWKREKFTVPYDEEEHFSEDELGNLANLPGIKKVVTTSEILYNYYIPEMNDPALLNSCIGRLITSVAQGKNYASFYWLGSKLLQKRINIIENAIKNKTLAIDNVNEMCYYKLIDYSVYTLSAYIGMKIPRLSLVKDYLKIIDDKNFIDGFASQQKYGFKLRKMSRVSKLILVNEFIKLCYQTYEEKSFDKNFNLNYAYMSLFLSFFAKQCGNLNPVNLNAKLMLDMKNETTKESLYVKGLLEDDNVSNNYSHFFNLDYIMQYNLCIN